MKMFKGKRVIASFLVLVLMGIVTSCSTEKSSYNAKVKDEKVVLSDLQEPSNYEGIDMITEIEDDEGIHVALHYPQFESEILNEEIDAIVKEQHHLFTEALSVSEYVFTKDSPALLNLSFEIYPFGEDLYSIVFSEKMFTGGESSTESSIILLVDLKQNKFVEGTTIFHLNENNQLQLFEAVNKLFQEDPDYQNVYDEMALQTVLANPTRIFSQVYIHDGKVTFRFNKFEGVDGSLGIAEVSMPIEELAHMVTPEWKARILSDDEVEDEAEKDLNRIEENQTDHTPAQSDEEENEGEEAIIDAGKRVALTFDDGPHPVNTQKILVLLEKYNAKATFFQLGSRVDFYSSITKEVYDQGHEIASHTWDHPDLRDLSTAEVEKQIESTQQAIELVIGEKPDFFRPPYGATNQAVKEVASRFGETEILWSLDTKDWESRNPKTILKVVKSEVKDGSVILMHDIHDTTVEAVEPILKYLQAEGYEMVTLSELYQE